MRTSPIVAKYKVNERQEITITYDIGHVGSENIFQVVASHPNWKPGSIITIDEEMMQTILDEFLNYTQTGEAPRIGADKTKL